MDKAALKNELRNVFNNVVTILGEVSEQELNTRPFEGSWNIGEVTEHIIICSRGIPDQHVQEAGRAFDENVDTLNTIFLDMSQKSEAAPGVRPRHVSHNRGELVSALRDNENALSGLLEEKDLALLAMDMEFPYMGYLTRYEWLHFIRVHTQRHFNQIKNIRQYLSDHYTN